MALLRRRSTPDLTGLAAALGRQEKPLALAEGDDLVLLGTRSALALRRAAQWQVWDWQQVASGSWQSEEQVFTWRTLAGEEHEAKLTRPGALPQLFRERVQAATLVTSVIDVPGGQVQLVARRSLDDSGQVQWFAVPTPGVDLAEKTIRDVVVARTDQLRAELS